MDGAWWGSRGLMDLKNVKKLDLKNEVTKGCGFESRLRQEVHTVGCPLLQVHLDGLNAENTFHSSLYSV